MVWTRSRAEARIRRFMDTAPTITVERYVEEYLPRLEILRTAARLRGDHSTADAPPLFNLPGGAAVLVDTVQIYVRALNHDEVRLEQGRETAASHARSMAFLHMLYAASDRVVEDAACQRVDHHGARMHAVVMEPRGAGGMGQRVAKALELAEEMMALAQAASKEMFSALNFDLRFRVGIDLGPCVAINSGRSDEREPMFIGPAANHAAKLVDGTEEGVYLSDNVRAALGLRRLTTLDEQKVNPASPLELEKLRAAGDFRDDQLTKRRLDEWRRDLVDGRVSRVEPAAFTFHHHTPPLRDIDYAALSPSNSIRMPMVSIFADLDKYTRYIDDCMRDNRIGEAVRLLHILRSELNAVLQEDFKGRKVRFVGDCVHGILADGTSHQVDEAASVTLAAKCAGALRSSFKLCQEILPEARRLDLQVGLELGPTPVSRIGIRGERAVRTASSLAVRVSEQCQRMCRDDATIIGMAAFTAATPAIRQLFPGQVANDLDYNDVATQVDPRGVSAQVAGASSVLATPVIAAEPARAYGK